MGRLLTRVLVLYKVLCHSNAEELGRREILNQNDQDNRNRIITLPLLSHEHMLQRRRRHLDVVVDELGDDDVHITPDEITWGQLYQGYGTHYVDLHIGSPIPQRQTLIIDTGSDITAFPCQECIDCGDDSHTDEVYFHQKSDTFRKRDCTKHSCHIGHCIHRGSSHSSSTIEGAYCKISLSYAEGSKWTAYEAIDQVYIGGEHEMPIPMDQDDNENEDTEDRLLSTVSNKAVSNPTMNVRRAKLHDDRIDNAFKGEVKKAQGRYKEGLSHSLAKPSAAHKFSFPLLFGCQSEITGLFKSQLADGIMGMEQSKSSFWHQMYTHNMIEEKKFSLCFNHADNASKEGTHAGLISLGGVDTRLHKSQMVYAENVKDRGWFTVYVNAIYLKKDGDGNEQSNEDLKASDDNILKLDLDVPGLNKHGFIIDSGTTASYLPRMMKGPFSNGYATLFGKEFIESIDDSNGDNTLTDYPTVIMQLKAAKRVSKDEIRDSNDTVLHGLAQSLDPQNELDVLVEIPPSHYMIYDKRKKRYSNRLRMNEDDTAVLGANAMFGLDILFDMEKQRIGFAKSDCTYESIIQ